MNRRSGPGEDLDHLRSEGDLNLSPRRRAWTTESIAAETQRLLEEDAKYFLHQSLSTPCLNALRSCRGAWIEDVEGRRYLDFHGSNVHQVGFSHPRVIAAIKEQLDTLSFCTRRYTCEPAVALAKRIAELAPGDLDRVLFAPGGTTAIGMALKLARVATGPCGIRSTARRWMPFRWAAKPCSEAGSARCCPAANTPRRRTRVTVRSAAATPAIWPAPITLDTSWKRKGTWRP